ncbi:Hepatocellular carcinoma-associated antigen 59 [Penicillium psychrosexuale]|uniref:Hepatocellular carcinoma-associated antigen 59 n=1 Tax=Penicillium psychrosexuale TaxID=1002107 RepID=UPI00254516A0|nr:Hepatocellular carcinoma-associated antigen 59 [Penicillium psychrosexuale]KAJ5783447.1 Hepatocellular carcinoma-associated antigen 59 [Penicillium psychrosexuale]
MDTQEDILPIESLFRPAKKRKFMRRRPDHEILDTEEADNQNDNPGASQALGSNNLRRPRAIRKGGIGFSTASRLGDDQGQQLALVPAAGDTENEKIQAMNERFTGYTGQTVDVDKHMYGFFPAADRPNRLVWTNEIRMAFIDSEMAKRYQPESKADHSGSNQSTQEEVAGGLSLPGHQTREPASLGKLHEIDLGQEATLRNIARTEAATRQMTENGGLPASVDTASETGRPGPDGKSWRNRKQRTDADIARDRLVEEVLRESKLEIYDEQEEETQLDDQQAADDRVAEQFRRDFMDAMQSRRRTRPAAKPVANVEAPRGPKLGGSRSARAAMREKEAQAGKK